jgi:hypothetical protein
MFFILCALITYSTAAEQKVGFTKSDEITEKLILIAKNNKYKNYKSKRSNLRRNRKLKKTIKLKDGNRYKEIRNESKREKLKVNDYNLKGLEKQQGKKETQERKELGEGSKKGQESR